MASLSVASARVASAKSGHDAQPPATRILFLCTAHNSLSQRLFLVLSRKHSVTVEYALSEATMIEAAELAKPHLILCPFLTTRVPREVHDKYLTLIVHPGPSGDAGPRALDWLLMGDDGTEPDCDKLLRNDAFSPIGRSHWGVTVLQAIGELDAGPVWAFDQFPVDINEPGLTKSSLYRGPVTQAALLATLAALGQPLSPPASPGSQGRGASDGAIHPRLVARKSYAKLCALSAQPFRGGPVHRRPLLKAGQRDWDPARHGAADVSRRIRSADSQPGCLSAVLGPRLYVYSGVVDDGASAYGTAAAAAAADTPPGRIVATRDEAVCLSTRDGRGVWITHVRRVKTKADAALWPKVPAVPGLRDLGCALPPPPRRALNHHDWARARLATFQETWVEFAAGDKGRVAYVYFEAYNGALSTAQCRRLVACLEYVLSTARHHDDERRRLAAVVLMGGRSYFCNGIHLNVIEAAPDAALESWLNINAIDDVECLLRDFPRRGVTTVAALRGNCAAGGVALATACDVVAAEHVVVNPAYRALGLSGSGFHSLTYPARCGSRAAAHVLRAMTPLSADDARRRPAPRRRRPRPRRRPRALRRRLEAKGGPVAPRPGPRPHRRAGPDGHVDFWSPRSSRYHARRRDFVRKAKPAATPLRFAAHRRGPGALDDEDDRFDSLEWHANQARRQVARDLSAHVARLMDDLSQASLDAEGPCAAQGSRRSERGRLSEGRQTLFPCYYASSSSPS